MTDINVIKKINVLIIYKVINEFEFYESSLDYMEAKMYILRIIKQRK